MTIFDGQKNSGTDALFCFTSRRILNRMCEKLLFVSHQSLCQLTCRPQSGHMMLRYPKARTVSDKGLKERPSNSHTATANPTAFGLVNAEQR